MKRRTGDFCGSLAMAAVGRGSIGGEQATLIGSKPGAAPAEYCRIGEQFAGLAGEQTRRTDASTSPTPVECRRSWLACATDEAVAIITGARHWSAADGCAGGPATAMTATPPPPCCAGANDEIRALPTGGCDAPGHKLVREPWRPWSGIEW